MNLIKAFQVLFNNKTINQDRIDGSVKIAEEFAMEFAKWIIKKNKEEIFTGKLSQITLCDNQQLLELFKQEKEIESTNKIYSRATVHTNDYKKTPQELVDALIVKYNSFENKQLDNISILALKAIKEKIEYLLKHYPEIKIIAPLNNFKPNSDEQ